MSLIAQVEDQRSMASLGSLHKIFDNYCEISVLSVGYINSSVGQHYMDTPNAVDELGEADIRGNTGEGKRLFTLQTELTPHKIEHIIKRGDNRHIQGFAEAKRYPPRR